MNKNDCAYFRFDNKVTKQTICSLRMFHYFRKLFSNNYCINQREESERATQIEESERADQIEYGTKDNPYCLDMDHKTFLHILEIARNGNMYSAPLYVYDWLGILNETDPPQIDAFIKINVGGKKFMTTLSNLKKIPYFVSLLDVFQNDLRKSIDRSHKGFKHILRSIRCPTYLVPKKYSLDQLFFGLEPERNTSISAYHGTSLFEPSAPMIECITTEKKSGDTEVVFCITTQKEHARITSELSYIKIIPNESFDWNEELETMIDSIMLCQYETTTQKIHWDMCAAMMKTLYPEQYLTFLHFIKEKICILIPLFFFWVGRKVFFKYELMGNANIKIIFNKLFINDKCTCTLYWHYTMINQRWFDCDSSMYYEKLIPRNGWQIMRHKYKHNNQFMEVALKKNHRKINSIIIQIITDCQTEPLVYVQGIKMTPVKEQIFFFMDPTLSIINLNNARQTHSEYYPKRIYFANTPITFESNDKFFLHFVLSCESAYIKCWVTEEWV